MLERLARPFSRLALAPFAIPLLLITPVWLKNRLWVPTGDFVPTLAVLLSISAGLLILFRLTSRDWKKASILATITIGFILYSPGFASALSDNPHIRLLIIGVAGLLAYAIGRQLPPDEAALAKANGMLHLALLAFVLPSILTAGLNSFLLEKGRPDPEKFFEPFIARASPSSPDVWHIVMDRYPNSDTLARIYNYDNSDFLDALKRRGFAINRSAHSNYQVTHQSLASTLNADYLTDFGNAVGHPDDKGPLFNAVRKNQAAKFFADNGYKVIFAGSWANITTQMHLVDQEIRFRKLSEVPRIALKNSVAGELASYFELPFGNARTDQCLREKDKFQRLRSIAGEGDRKYIFAHFLIPHPPFVFGPEGDCQSVGDEARNTRRQNTVQQIAYANHELIALIDAILAGPRPATIMLHADEGPYPAQFAGDEAFHSVPLAPREEWLNTGPEIWREKMGILMAVRHAQGPTNQAPDTPINLYPIVLNRSFSGQMPLRQEKSYFFLDPNRRYEFTDVTADISADIPQ